VAPPLQRLRQLTLPNNRGDDGLCAWASACGTGLVVSRDTCGVDDDRDAYLDRVLIGGREPVAITVVDYDEQWFRRFQDTAGRVRRVLADEALSLEHIGSTSVPGLVAKPIIDMLLTVVEVSDDAAYVPALESVGFVLRVREPEHGCCGPRRVTCICTSTSRTVPRFVTTSTCATGFVSTSTIALYAAEKRLLLPEQPKQRWEAALRGVADHPHRGGVVAHSLLSALLDSARLRPGLGLADPELALCPALDLGIASQVTQ